MACVLSQKMIPGIREQNSSSTTAGAAFFKALAVVPVVAVYVGVVGAQQVIEPRQQHFHAQYNNTTLMTGPHTR